MGRIKIKGNHAYMTGDRLRFFDITNTGVKGYEKMPPTNALAISGNHIFVTYQYDGLEEAGLKILDISNPTNPREIGSLQSKMGPDLAVYGDYAFGAAEGNGIEIIDVSTPNQPKLLKNINTSNSVFSIDVTRGFIYAAAYDSLIIFDISDPSHLKKRGVYADEYVGSVSVQDILACITVSVNEIKLIDVSDPDNPYELGSFNMSGNATIKNNFLYLAAKNNGLIIIDISDPSNPVQIGVFNNRTNISQVIVKDNYAYTAGSSLQIIDISDVNDLQRVSYYNKFPVSKITMNNNYIYVAATYHGMRVIDISDPAAPKSIGGIDTRASVYDVSVAGDYVYVANNNFGVSVVDVSDLENLKEVGYYETGYNPYRVIASENLVYIADGQDGFYIIANDLINTLPENDNYSSQISYKLLQNYPNPFNPSTQISFRLPQQEHVTLEVYNTLGQNIETLLNKPMIAGNHLVEFNAKNLPSGIYFYRIEAGEFRQVKKMVLLR